MPSSSVRQNVAALCSCVGALGILGASAAASSPLATNASTAAKAAAIVNTAIARGPNAVQTLVNTPQSNPDVARILLSHATVTSTSSPVQPGPAATLMPSDQALASPVAASSYCWRAQSHQVTVSSFGINLGWSKIEVYSWCGNGSSITSNNGYYPTAWAGALYCLTNYNRSFGWLQKPAWLHGQSSVSLGGGVNGLCQPLQTMNATMRVAANGYYDYSY